MPKDMKGVMREYSTGDLHSGSSRGPVVRNRKQAVAIALSEQKKMNPLDKVMSKVGVKY